MRWRSSSSVGAAVTANDAGVVFSVLRHQLPAYSPISLGMALGALGDRLIGASRQTSRLASLLQRELDADEVLLVDSGRSALQLAIELSAPRPHGNHVVALPAFQCFEVGSAAVGADAQVVFYDIDPATLGPDFDSLASALATGATTIVVAPLYAMPVDWDALAGLASAHGAVVIEDAAQGYGASWKERRLGSLGALSVVSFGRGKGWTGGGGGALCLRHGQRSSKEMGTIRDVTVSRELKLLFTALAQSVLGRPSLYGIPASLPGLELGETRYHAPTPPFRAAHFSEALASRAFEASSLEAEARRRAGEAWREQLPRHLVAAAPRAIAGASPGYLRFPLRIADGARWLRQSSVARRLGVAPSYPSPLFEVPAVARRIFRPHARLSGAETLARELVTLPTHTRVSQSDRRNILSVCERLEAPAR